MSQPFRAYAKINIGLRILEKRPDGYHNIETIFHKIDLYDEIRFSPSPTIKVESTSEDAPGNESNICHKAARLLQELLGVEEGVCISLTKNIPVGAGLGGGSSDAAIVLRELPRFWKKAVDDVTLRRIALLLGSDVPFFLGKTSALGLGRGEELEYFELDLPYFVLLCFANIHITTARAYARVMPSKSLHSKNLRQILRSNLTDIGTLTEEIRNDFELTVFEEYPGVLRGKQLLLKAGAVFASLSGSGSSVYGFFKDEHIAGRAVQQLQAEGYQTFLTPPHFTPRSDS